MAVELRDDAVDAVQVARAGVVVDPHAVADDKHRERFLRVDGVQELPAGVDGLGDRDKMIIKFTGGDVVQKEPLRLAH